MLVCVHIQPFKHIFSPLLLVSRNYFKSKLVSLGKKLACGVYAYDATVVFIP